MTELHMDLKSKGMPMLCINSAVTFDAQIRGLNRIIAVTKGAVCLDGSPPAYQFDKGFEEGANSWLLNLEGGEWCGTPKDCMKRTNYLNGLDTATDPHSPEIRKESIRQGTQLFYRGARIFDAIVEKLLQLGMSKASNVLLSGNSAGGLASILHYDRFRAFLTVTARVKCFSDGGYFIHAAMCFKWRDISGKYHFEEVMFDRVVRLHTPLFILNSAYVVWQIPRILALTNIDVRWSFLDFRHEVVHGVVTGLQNNPSGGYFINTCYAHCQSLHHKKWLLDIHSRVNNKSISEAVGEWYYDRGVVQLIDHQNRWPHECVLDEGEPNRQNNYTWPG
ncbi:hypothetical protein LguiB_009666 [Lonicera macranthoides]